MDTGAADKKWAKKIRRLPPVMGLSESSDSHMLFLFHSRHAGFMTAFFAGFGWFIALLMTHRQGVSLAVPIIFYIFALLLTYSSIWSFATRRSLEIDFIGRVVILRQKTLSSETTRPEGFDQLRITVGPWGLPYGQYGNLPNYGVILEYKDGWQECLGVFGSSVARATALANKIALKTGIELNAPTYFEEKPLKGE